MNCGAAPLLDKTPKGLHIVMVHAPSAKAQPFALALLHHVKGDVRVLKMFAGFDGVQVRFAKDEAVSTERVSVRTSRQSPPFHPAISARQDWVNAHQPGNWVADVQ